MSKITLTSLADLVNQTTAVNTINSNNATIQTAWDNTLSRDGTTPNQMGATLDMNSNKIINLPLPTTSNEPIRLQDAPSINPSIGLTPASVVSLGVIKAFSATGTPAGGTTGSGFTIGSTSNLGIFFGSGLPTLSAAQGSLYLRTDGSSASTRLYVNINGTNGWTNVTTAT